MPEQLLDQLNKNHDQQIDAQELQKAFANKFFENKQNRDQLSYELNQGINTLLEESFCRALTTAYLDAKKRIGQTQEQSVVLLWAPGDRAIMQLFHELSTYNNQLMHLQQELEQKKVATDTQYKELQEGKIGSDKWMQGQLRQFEAHNWFARWTYQQKQQLLITESKKIDTMQGLSAQQKESLKINLLLALTRDKKTGWLTVFGIQDRVSKQRPAYDTAIQQLQAQKTAFEANCSPEDINAIAQNTYNDSESKYRPVLNDKQRMLKAQLESIILEEKKLQEVASYFAKIQALPCSALAMPMQQFAAGREWQIPFISWIQDLWRTLDILNISKKQSAGQSLSPSEQLLLWSFAALEQGRNAVSAMKMTWYDIGSGTSSTVNFLVEIGLSGGLIGLWRKAITAWVKKWTTQVIKWIVRKESRKEAIGVVAKGAKEAAKIGLKMTWTIQAHNTARNVVDELVPEYGLQLDADGEVDIAEYGPGSSIIKWVIKWVAKAFINNTAEQIWGPIVNELFGYLPKSVLSNRVLRVLETGQMKKILQDGFVWESIEEFISQWLTWLHDAARGDQKLSEIYSMYGAKVTVLTCMLVSGGVQGLKISGNKINFTDHGQAKIIDLWTKENITTLTPEQEQKTESAIKETWKKALVENKWLVTNLKQQIDIIRQDFDSEIRKQNTPEWERSRQNFWEFWKNMSKIGVTWLVTRLPPLVFIPGSQVVLLYMSQNQKNIKKFLWLTFHALGEIEKSNIEKKQMQKENMQKKSNDILFGKEEQDPSKISTMEEYVKRLQQAGFSAIELEHIMQDPVSFNALHEQFSSNHGGWPYGGSLNFTDYLNNSVSPDFIKGILKWRSLGLVVDGFCGVWQSLTSHYEFLKSIGGMKQYLACDIVNAPGDAITQMQKDGIHAGFLHTDLLSLLRTLPPGKIDMLTLHGVDNTITNTTYMEEVLREANKKMSSGGMIYGLCSTFLEEFSRDKKKLDEIFGKWGYIIHEWTFIDEYCIEKKTPAADVTLQTENRDVTKTNSENPTPQEIQEVQAYVEEVNEDMNELDQAIQKDDVVAIQHALDAWDQEVTKTKQSLLKWKVSALRAVARQVLMINYGEHIVHAVWHASGKARELIFTKWTVYEKLATTLALTGEVIGILYHGGHLAHVLAHPDPQGYLSLSRLSTETVVIDSFTHKLESFGKSMLMWAEQHKAYTELQNITPWLLEQLQAASPIRREKLREGISDKLFKLQFKENHAIVDETLMRLVHNPTQEDMTQLEAIISVLNPNRLEHFKLLWSYSNTMASEKIGKTMKNYTPEMDWLY